MKRLLLLWVVTGLAAGGFLAADEKSKDSKAVDRVQAAATVLDEIESAPDQGIPEEVLGSAECVAVVPSMLKEDSFRRSLWPRSCQLPYTQGLERACVLQHQGR